MFDNRLKVSPEKVRAIQELPAPTDVAGVKRVLGLVQYWVKFIPNLSDVSDPLRILVKNDVQWHWNVLQYDHAQSFRTGIERNNNRFINIVKSQHGCC
jgi:hypothetical protein